MKYLSLLLTSVVFFLNACSNGQNQTVKTDLSATEFQAKMNELPSAAIIDVRTPEEFSKGHIANAKNIDWNGNNFEKQINEMDKTKPVFVYCLSGGRSGAAADKMRALGFTTVYEMDGGMMKWRAANLPETTDNIAGKEAQGMSKAQFDALLNSEKLVLIDFYADWCLPCKKMAPYLEELKTEMVDQLTIVRINADENPALCKELKVDALPVLLLYKNKTITWQNTGYISKEDLVKHLN